MINLSGKDKTRIFLWNQINRSPSGEVVKKKKNQDEDLSQNISKESLPRILKRNRRKESCHLTTKI